MATYTCSLDGSPAAACASPAAYTDLTEGTHMFEATGTDQLGNVGAPADWSWTVDLTAPVTTIGSGPADPTTDTSAAFAFSADDPSAAFACSLDGGAASSCSSPVTYDGLGQGLHTFEVTATDPAGNTGAPADWSWTITGFLAPGRRLA